ncbi:MAG: bifunctional glutamate N-acetyltransferase/amino-acid acetyltransferase ArgJ [Candidatus Nanopelagicales bacterium]
MSICTPEGFIAGTASAELRSDGSDDLAVVINEGPKWAAAAVFTKNKVKAAPVLWSEQAIKSGLCRAVVLNSGGANACTGAQGFEVAHKTAEHLAQKLETGAIEVQVCSTGLIGKQLDISKLKPAIDQAVESASKAGGEAAAWAILTTDTQAKMEVIQRPNYSLAGMIKGAGMLAPDLATMLCVITTDAELTSEELNHALKNAVEKTLNRIDSDGCTSTNDTVLIMSSGAKGRCDLREFETDLKVLLHKLGQKLINDAEGSTKTITVTVKNCATEEMATSAARAVARNNLFKTAMYGADPNWGRILAALGVIDFDFDQFKVDVYLNGSLVCKSGERFNAKTKTEIDLSDRLIEVVIDFNQGNATSTVWTNDLSERYVYENSAYST